MDQKKNWRFCVAGNIVNSHLDEYGIVRYGTKAFAGGTKVYLNGKTWSDDSGDIGVIGLNRFGRYVLEWIPISLIKNMRSQRVFKNVVLSIIDYEEQVENWLWWGRTAADKRETIAFTEKYNNNDSE